MNAPLSARILDQRRRRSVGGFLGMGEGHYPTPWSNLKYDANLGGYLVNLTKDQLEQAPKYANENDWQWSRENDKRVYDYYRASPYWPIS